VQQTIAKYGILDEDIYNFDETGFQMGVIATAKVVTGADRAGRPRPVQPGNRVGYGYRDNRSLWSSDSASHHLPSGDASEELV
jgi:hypothetical protein